MNRTVAFVLRTTSGLRVSTEYGALSLLVVYATDRSKAVVLV